MLINVFLTSFFAGLGAVFLSRGRYERLLSFLLSCGFAFLLVNFVENWAIGASGKLAVHWFHRQNLQLDLSLASTLEYFQFLAPLVLLSLLLMLVNSFYKKEPASLELNGILLLNLACYVLLVASEETIQLLIASSAITVTGFYIADNLEAKKKYVFYNLLADVGLLTVFAVIYGQGKILSLHDLGEYREGSVLVSFLLVAAVMIKSGLFMFQNQLLDLSVLNFNRLMMMSFLSAPVAGIIVLLKTFALLELHPYLVVMVEVVAFASLLWGFCGAMVIDSLKEKSLYLNMMAYALCYFVMIRDYDLAVKMIPPLLVVSYLVVTTLFWINVASSNEDYVSAMGGFGKSLKLTFLFSLLVVACLVMFYLKAFRQIWGWELWTWLALFLIAISHIYCNIYLGRSEADEKVLALIRNPGFIFWFPPLLLTVAWVGYLKWLTPAFYGLMSAFLLLWLAAPFRRLDRLAENESIQDSDPFAWLYHLLILTPLTILGRVLWLTVDFLLIERTVMTSLSQLMRLLVRLVGSLHRSSLPVSVLLMLLGVLLMFAMVRAGS